MGASLHVGRVGVLASALGIGAALTVGGAATSWADTGADSSGRSAASDQGPRRSHQSGNRAAKAARGGNSAPAAANAVSVPRRPVVAADAVTLDRPRAVVLQRPAAVTASSEAAAAPAVPATPATPTAPPAVTAPSAPAHPIAATARLLGGTLGPLSGAGSTPGQPANSTGIWTVLAAVRREFFNTSPTITPVIYGQTTSDTGEAVITGNIGAADADGDTLYYTYIGTPQNGGTLDLDQANGDFTYTAPASMNELGGFDQFNIVVSDQTPGKLPTFHGIGDLISRIPVIGPPIIDTLQLFGLAPLYTGSVPARVPITVTPTQPAPPLTGSAAELSATPIQAQSDWRRYVLTPEGCSQDTTCTVRPVSLYYKNAGVSVAEDGAITLIYRLGAEAPVAILDFGQDVGGYTRMSIAAATPNILRTSYSESLSNMSIIGDGALSTILLANSGSPLTFQATPVLGPREWQSKKLQGGYRYQLITMDLPGSITISDISTQMTAPLRSADGYSGHFLSDSDMLNRIWYAGAYTINLDEISAGTPGFAGPYPLSILGEAAKRDRAIWAGDLLTAGATLHDVFGAHGDTLARNNLTIMSDNPVRQIVLEPLSLPFRAPSKLTTPGPAPGVCSGVSKGGCSFWGASYSMALAQNMGNYYRLTGDTEFVRQNWAAVQRAVAYGNSLINEKTGLVDVPKIASLDWSVVGRAKGQVTSTNVIQYDSLTNAATLAAAIGETAAAEQYGAQAAALKKAINDNLWNPEMGAYDASTKSRGYVVQDANTWAVLYGVADAERSAQIVQTLADTLSTEYGLRAAPEGVRGYPTIVSPFIGSFGLPANYLAGRPDLAMDQLLTTWGYMADSDAGSTTWERINLPDGNLEGTIPYLFGDSASHAWSTGATAALSEHVLGITPTSIAYRTWQVKPFPQDMQWAQGQVPTAQGPIASRFELGDNVFRLTVEAPDGTTGTVAVPTLGSPRVIYRDGVQVWDGTSAVSGAIASATADGYVEFRQVSGAHTWAWG